MYAECLPYTQIPHTSRLFSDFLYDFPRVQQFFSAPPQPERWTPQQLQRPDYDAARRARVADVLARQNRSWNAAAATLAAVERFRSGAVAVVTGQQVGLFGGPTFTLYKALTAILVAREVSARGTPAVPIFWLATEDHDFAEVSSVTVPSGPGELRNIAIASSSPPDAPVGTRALEADATSAVAALRESLGDSEVLDWIAEAYAPGTTMGDAFARLIARIFGRFGLIVVDPSDPELHRVASPVFQQVVSENAAFNAALLARSKELTSAGYHEQVKVTPATSLLFHLRDGQRVPLRRNNGDFVAGTEKLSAAELARIAANEPESLSANALLRPAVQDYLLPTVAYVGGAAEVAYFAQSAVVQQRVLGRVTPVLPRLSATLIETRGARLLEKYQLTFSDLFHGPERTRETLAARNLPPSIEQTISSAATRVEAEFARVKSDLTQLDSTLAGATDRVAKKVGHQLERLRARAARAELRRNTELVRHADRLSAILYPHKGLQERTIAGVYWLARYGPALLDDLAATLRTECPDHQLVRW